jgi:hypothetical protein
MAAAGATLVVSSHVMDEAERCDQLVLLHEGQIIATGAPSELRAQTGAPDLEQAFLGLLEPCGRQRRGVRERGGCGDGGVEDPGGGAGGQVPEARMPARTPKAEPRPAAAGDPVAAGWRRFRWRADACRGGAR